MSFWIHPSSYIDPDVTIGSGTKIWHFCHLLTGATIGKGCTLGQNCMVGARVVIGDRVKIQNNVSIVEGVTLEDDVFIAPSVVFTNILNPRSFIDRKDQFLATTVRKGASVGANTTILCGCTIGMYALIGAGSLILKNVPDFALVVGHPAAQIGWVSCRGNRLHFGSSWEAIDQEDGSCYQLINGVVSIK